jgi:hypothetical protein
MRPVFIAALLLLGAGCELIPGDIDDCSAPGTLPQAGPYDDLAMPDGGTLAPWVETLAEEGVEVRAQWADGWPFTFWVVLTEHADDAALSGAVCDSPMLRLDVEATVGVWPDLLFAGPARVVRWEPDGVTHSLLLDIEDIEVAAEHVPYPDWRIYRSTWRFELHEVGGVAYASLDWSSTRPVVVNGTYQTAGRLFGTPGHPWTAPR